MAVQKLNYCRSFLRNNRSTGFTTLDQTNKKRDETPKGVVALIFGKLNLELPAYKSFHSLVLRKPQFVV